MVQKSKIQNKQRFNVKTFIVQMQKTELKFRCHLLQSFCEKRSMNDFNQSRGQKLSLTIM